MSAPDIHPYIKRDKGCYRIHCTKTGKTAEVRNNNTGGVPFDVLVKKFTKMGWVITPNSAYAPKDKKMQPITPNLDRKAKEKTDMALFDPRKPNLAPQLPTSQKAPEPPRPASPLPKNQLVLALIEAASIMDSSRTDLSEYTTEELFAELQNRVR